MYKIMDNIYLGSADDAIEVSNGNEIEIIIYLGQELPQKLSFNCEKTCVHIPLNDGLNDYDKLRNAVSIIIAILALNKPTLVSCRACLSRSPLVMACIVSAVEDIPFEHALELIRNQNKAIQPEHNLRTQLELLASELRMEAPKCYL